MKPPFLIIALLYGHVSFAQTPDSGASDVVHASISGVRIKADSALLDDSITFVSAINGSSTGIKKKTWSKPALLQPGTTIISGSFSRGSYKARADIEFVAISGHDYSLMFDTNAKWRAGDYYCDFWVMDTDSKQTVSNVVRTKIIYPRIIIPASVD